MTETPKRTSAKSAAASNEKPELAESPDVRTAIITGLTFGPKVVQYAVVDGRGIFEGDIDLGTVEEIEKSTAAFHGGGAETGSVIPGSHLRWLSGTVPYEIDLAMPDQQRVQDAIAHWEANTVIQFVRRTPSNAASHPNFVRFIHGRGCFSAVGMRGGPQDISVGMGSQSGHGIHQIGHAMGLWHEQSREDRDSFVTIHWQNIRARLEHNFNQHVSDGDNVGPYDYGSIMHFEGRAFSRNGLETITSTNPNTAQLCQRLALSQGDRDAITSMYGSRQR